MWGYDGVWRRSSTPPQEGTRADTEETQKCGVIRIGGTTHAHVRDREENERAGERRALNSVVDHLTKYAHRHTTLPLWIVTSCKARPHLHRQTRTYDAFSTALRPSFALRRICLAFPSLNYAKVASLLKA